MTVLEELDTAVIELDANDRVRGVNSAAEEYLVLKRDRLLGQLIHDVDGFPEELCRAVSDSREEQRPRRLRELRLGDGQYDCQLKLLRDRTLIMEIHSLEWNRQQKQLAQFEVQTGLMDLLRRNLGHEIRNPLGGIRGAAQMLAAELEEQELGTLARLIMRESDRIDELIKRFWQPEMHREEIDIYRPLEESLQLLLTESGKSISVRRDYDPSIPMIRADASAIRQVFLNFARNAWQANAKNLVVRTRIEHGSRLLERGHGMALLVDFEDDGEGVPESLKPLLFLPMVTGRRDGTGLGLAITQQIAADHGGLVSYKSLDQGSRFRLRIPVGNGTEREADDG